MGIITPLFLSLKKLGINFKLNIPSLFYKRWCLKLFLIGLFIGLVLGSNISHFLYALIIAGKQADEQLENMIEVR